MISSTAHIHNWHGRTILCPWYILIYTHIHTYANKKRKQRRKQGCGILNAIFIFLWDDRVMMAHQSIKSLNLSKLHSNGNPLELSENTGVVHFTTLNKWLLWFPNNTLSPLCLVIEKVCNQLSSLDKKKKVALYAPQPAMRNSFPTPDVSKITLTKSGAMATPAPRVSCLLPPTSFRKTWIFIFLD